MRLASGTPLEIGPQLARGGEGAIFALREPKGMVLKRLHDELLARAPHRRARIEAMVGDRPSGWREAASGHVLLAWPSDLVLEGDRFVGFVMPQVDLATTAELHNVANPSDRRAPGQNMPGWVASFTWHHLLQTAANLALAIQVLHDDDVVVGDFQERNVLVRSDTRVTLVDCDSMQVTDATGRVFHCEVGRPEFTAPELLGADLATTVRRPSSDLFALAVHIYQLLMQGAHPFDGLWHGPGDKPKRHRLAAQGEFANAGRQLSPHPTAMPFDLLPGPVQALFTRAFVDGATDPDARPTGDEWQRVLGETAAKLKTCGKVPSHVYPEHHADCPWCAHEAHVAAAKALPPQTALTPAAGPPAPGFRRAAGVNPGGGTGVAARWQQLPARARVGAIAAAVVVLILLMAVAAGGGGDDPEVSAAGADAPAATPRTTDAPSPTTADDLDGVSATSSTETTTAVTANGGWVLPGAAEECDTSTAHLVEGRAVAVVDCYDAYELVDLGTGTSAHVEKVDNTEGNIRDGIVGERYLWLETTEIPATGLEPPKRRFTVRSRALDGSDTKELVVLDGDQYSQVSLVEISGSRFLTSESINLGTDGNAVLVLRDVDGTEVARFDTGDGGYSDDEIFDGILAGGAVVDMARGEQVPEDAAAIRYGGPQYTDRCTQAGLAGSEAPLSIVRRGPDGLRVTGSAGSADYATAVAAGDRLLGTGDSGLEAYRSDGTVLWTLSREVVSDWGVFGGVPFIKNAAYEVVPVDPETGEEATVSPELLEAGTALLEGGYMDVDSSTGNVLLVDYERGLKVTEIPECKVR